MRDDAARQHLDRLIAEDHANAVLQLIDSSNLSPTLIGFHGQTIYHNPTGDDGHPLGRTTIQLGDAALLAAKTGLPVVHDVRRADMAAGGQGAPLAPVFHAAMLARLAVDLPAVLVNIGGVANLTWVANLTGVTNQTGIEDGTGVIGFDTGPGNALMDDYMRLYCDADFDKDGALAASGMPMPRLSIHGLMSLILPLVGQSRLIVRRFAIVLTMRDYWKRYQLMRWQALPYSRQIALLRQLINCLHRRKQS